METKNSNAKRFRARTHVVVALFTCLFLLVIGRAAHLAVIDRPFLANKALSQYSRKLVTQAMRGAVKDRMQQDMAVTLELLSVAVDPKVITDKAAAAKLLASALNLPESYIQKRLAAKSQFVRMARFVEPALVDEIKAQAKEAKIKGILFEPDPRRFYPGKTLAAQVLGYCGANGQGLEGVERFFNDDLSGRGTSLSVKVDASRRSFLTSSLPNLDHSGHNVILTIDRTIQAVAEVEIAKAVEINEAISGTVIVVRPQTGEILALAQAPLINSNSYGDHDAGLRRLRAVTDTYEPGSTLKIFTASAALESGLVTPDTVFFCENGNYRVGRHTIHDTHHYGNLTLAEIVKVSSNIGALKVGALIGKKRLHDSLRSFGFGSRTGIDFGGEVGGYMAPFQYWRDIHAGTIAFGQGISVTAMQVVAGTCAIANGGTLMKPYLVSAVTDSEGRVIKSFGPRAVRRAMSEDTARKVREMMALVTREGGTGTMAKMVGYSVCGKTGTAQKVENKVYAKGKYIASFVGFVPKDKPAIAMIVILDEPRGRQYYGGLVSAPVFKAVAERALPHFNVPPEILPETVVDETAAVDEAACSDPLPSISWQDDGSEGSADTF